MKTGDLVWIKGELVMLIKNRAWVDMPLLWDILYVRTGASGTHWEYEMVGA
tara:strand:- start:381 stop:533 length:153 start_codon:yes stop_codon:yes gene_type:complete